VDGWQTCNGSRDKSLKEKEVPIDMFFHKIVMVRDRLRVLEQKINTSALTDEEKVEIQQYVTRIMAASRPSTYFLKIRKTSLLGKKGREQQN